MFTCSAPLVSGTLREAQGPHPPRRVGGLPEREIIWNQARRGASCRSVHDTLEVVRALVSAPGVSGTSREQS